MIQKVLLHFHLQFLTCVGLILFMAVFTAALIWIFRKGSSNVYEGMSQLPLEDLRPQIKGEHRAC